MPSDTPGLGDHRGDRDAWYLQQIEGILDSEEIQLVIYYLKWSEKKMCQNLIHALMHECKKIGVKWEQVVGLIAHTFADGLHVSSKEKKPGFDMGCYFNNHLATWHADITKALVHQVGVKREVASKIKCYPTAHDLGWRLPNSESWYVPFRLGKLGDAVASSSSTSRTSVETHSFR